MSALPPSERVLRAAARLNSLKGHWPTIAKAAGLSYSWMSKFARGEVVNPTSLRLDALIREMNRIEANEQKVTSRATQ